MVAAQSVICSLSDDSGKVMDQDSMDVVRKIENLKTRAGDKPIKTVKVAASGTL